MNHNKNIIGQFLTNDEKERMLHDKFANCRDLNAVRRTVVKYAEL